MKKSTIFKTVNGIGFAANAASLCVPRSSPHYLGFKVLAAWCDVISCGIATVNTHKGLMQLITAQAKGEKRDMEKTKTIGKALLVEAGCVAALFGDCFSSPEGVGLPEISAMGVQAANLFIPFPLTRKQNIMPGVKP